MTKKTVTQLEAEMAQLEAAIRATATMTVADPDLTAEGKKRRHQAWARERRWHERYAELATGLTSALEGAQAQADQARAAMTEVPTGADAHAIEARFNRRKARVDAALTSNAGTGPLVDLIVSADDTEVGIICEYVADHLALVGGDQAKAGAQIVETALQARDPGYAEAARVAGAAGNAQAIARAKLDYMSQLLDDPATPAPGEFDYSGMSITGVVPAVSDLTAA